MRIIKSHRQSNGAVKGSTSIRCSQSTLEGKVVKNDGKALKAALSAQYDITDIEHSGNFRFTATCADGSTIHIDTEPADQAESKIKITHINHRSDVNSGTDIIVASEDDYTEDWIELKNKQVLDSDGFTTDYTLYTNSANTRFICMFGDRDVYEPDIDYADWVGDTVEEAYEWFDNYTSYDEDDDIYGSESDTCSDDDITTL